jgi:hypothetical protein
MKTKKLVDGLTENYMDVHPGDMSMAVDDVLNAIVDFNRSQQQSLGQATHSEDFTKLQNYLEAFGQTLDPDFDINE